MIEELNQAKKAGKSTSARKLQYPPKASNVTPTATDDPDTPREDMGLKEDVKESNTVEQFLNEDLDDGDGTEDDIQNDTVMDYGEFTQDQTGVGIGADNSVVRTLDQQVAYLEGHVRVEKQKNQVLESENLTLKGEIEELEFKEEKLRS